MAKARPLRKTGGKTGAKSVKERQLNGGEVKRTAAKRPPKPADRGGSRKPVALRPSPKAAVVPERQMVAPQAPPPLPAPIASFTF